MRRVGARVAVVAALAVLLSAGVAVALAVNPLGGQPGSAYTVTVNCAAKPQVYVVNLQAGPPPATLLPKSGAETSPGVWTYSLTAGDVDQQVTSQCGSASEQARYDVQNPKLFPGPTVANFEAWRPQSAGTTVVGTDCPAGTEAHVTFLGSGGFTASTTAAIDTYGNWEVPLPADAPAGTFTVNATCGAVTYQPLTMTHAAGGQPSVGAALPAAPVPGAPTYTG